MNSKPHSVKATVKPKPRHELMQANRRCPSRGEQHSRQRAQTGRVSIYSTKQKACCSLFVFMLLPTDLIQPKLKNKMWWLLNGNGRVTNMKHPITHISVYPQFKWNSGCPLTHHDKLNMPWQAYRWTRMPHLWGIVSMKQWLIMIYPTAHSLTCYGSVYGTHFRRRKV